ncbi:MAG: hypothetical protein ACAI35_00190 [Candidatus Methylacidiphilales bacterium]
MAYGSRPTAANPALLAFLLDQSQAMSAPGQSGQTKAEEATRAINRLIYLMAQSCVLPVEAPENAENPPEPQIEDRASIIVVGYNSGEAAPLLGDTLVNTASAPLRMESDTYEVQAEDGSTEAQTFELPVYLETVSTGATLAAPAFAVARDAIAGWSQTNWNSFPPVVIHITAGLPEDAEAIKPEIKGLKELATADGSLLLFQIVIGSEGEIDVLLPTDDSFVELKHCKGLAELSSILPSYILAMTRKVGFQTEDNARGALLPGGMAALDYFLNAVALVITGLAWDEDPAAIAADAAAAQEANAEAAAAVTAAPETPAATETAPSPEAVPATPAPEPSKTEEAVTAKPETDDVVVDDFILPETDTNLPSKPAAPASETPLPALPSPVQPSFTRKAASIGVPALPGAPQRPAGEPVSGTKPKSVVPSALAGDGPGSEDSEKSSVTSSSLPSSPYMTKARSLPTEPLVPSTPERPPLTPVRRAGELEANPIYKGGAKTVPQNEFGLSDNLASEAKAALDKVPLRRPGGTPPARPPIGPSVSTSASALGVSGGPGMRKIEDLDVRSGATMKMPVIRKTPAAEPSTPSFSAEASAPSAPPANMPSIPMAGPPGSTPAVPPMRAPKLPPRGPSGPPPTPMGGAPSSPGANRPGLPVGGGIGKDTSSLTSPPGGPSAPSAAAPFNAMEAHTVALPQPGWAKKRAPQPPAGIPGRAGSGPLPGVPVSGSSSASAPSASASAPSPSAPAPTPAGAAGGPPAVPTGAPKGSRMPPITQAKSSASSPAAATPDKPGTPPSPSKTDPLKKDAGKTLSPVVGPKPPVSPVILWGGIIAVIIIIFIIALIAVVKLVNPTTAKPQPAPAPATAPAAPKPTATR